MESKAPIESQHLQISKQIVNESKDVGTPEVKAKLGTVFENINKQEEDNYFLHQDESSGAVFPCTIVSVNNVVAECFPQEIPTPNQEQQAQPIPRRRVRVILPAVAIPPAGAPSTNEDMTFNAVIRRIPRVIGPLRRNLDIEQRNNQSAQPAETNGEESTEQTTTNRVPEAVPQEEVIFLGNPNGMEGGVVTREWMRRKNREGFGAYVDVYKKILEDKYLKNAAETTDFDIQGISFGTNMTGLLREALETAHPGLQGHIREIQDNPVIVDRNQSLLRKFGRRIQIPIAFLLEGLRLQKDEWFQATVHAEPEARAAFMERKGIQNQPSRKMLSAALDALILLRGIDNKQAQGRYQRVGEKDMLSGPFMWFLKSHVNARNRSGEAPPTRREMYTPTNTQENSAHSHLTAIREGRPPQTHAFYIGHPHLLAYRFPERWGEIIQWAMGKEEKEPQLAQDKPEEDNQ